MTTLLLAALAILQRAPVVETTVEFVDCNAVYDSDTGRIHLRQLVYHVESGDVYAISAWRIWQPGMVPVRRGEYYHAVWLDGDLLRRVRCRRVVESWLDHDYEVRMRTGVERRELGGRP